MQTSRIRIMIILHKILLHSHTRYHDIHFPPVEYWFSISNKCQLYLFHYTPQPKRIVLKVKVSDIRYVILSIQCQGIFPLLKFSSDSFMYFFVAAADKIVSNQIRRNR